MSTLQGFRMGGNPARLGLEQALLTYTKEGPVGEAMIMQGLHPVAELVQEAVEELEAAVKKELGDLFQV